jgi:hypothetical protein
MKRLLLVFIAVLVGLFMSIDLHAQCTNGNQYGSGTFEGCSGQPVAFTACIFGGEYSLANGIQSGLSYTFSGTGGTGNYLTIQDHVTLAILGSGISPVTVSPATSNPLRVYVHTNASCGTEIACHTLSGQCNASQPAITLMKTVGTVPGVCSDTTEITVSPGTMVYYCYTVTNTGNVTLNLHNLVDDSLGTIFSGLNYALTPGSSVNTVAAGLSIAAVINTTTTNTATWTAYNVGAAQTTAQASATVIVEETDKAIPTLSEWGMIIMSLLLGGTAIWMIRRRQTLKG